MPINTINDKPIATAGEHVQFEKVCNLTYLKKMSSGNKDFVQEIIKLYLKQAPVELAKLQKAITTDDQEAVKVIAHKLKSSASMLGADSIVLRLKRLEALTVSEAADTERVQLYNELEALNKQATEEELLPLIIHT
ncbi:Hpt domain-containing protein [Pontibacter silvestris]|uniref:Hpt domain-containing protein n=1 Tax=Pontibacter silvestris TaxID=2305183 RepID=A0ABW4X1R8_9BACT|nr:Hpt domain-containing protein [Pontibacter silvestris]MCC9135077.1 Hpt domain-containing protein [Pontibacter silvestris]